MRAAPAALTLLVLASTLSAATPTPAAGRALAWLAEDATADARYVTEAAAAAGIDPLAWPSAASPILTKALAQEWDPTTDAGYKANLRRAYDLAISGYDPRDAGGVDYVQLARDGFKGGQFGDPATLNDDIWAIFALRAAGAPANDTQIQGAALAILAARCPQGAWSWATTSVACDTDTTAMALLALSQAGMSVQGDPAASYLSSVKNADGCYDGATPHSTQSTMWVSYALDKMGDASGAEAARRAALAQQRPDGSFPPRCDKAGGSGPQVAFATAELAVLAAGLAQPQPGFAPGTVVLPIARAGESATFRVQGPFTSVAWTVDGVLRQGSALSLPHAGGYPYSVYAQGAGTRFRTSGTLTVLSARPVAVAPPEVETLRHVPFALDLSGSFDPDGEVRAARIDWGDGNITREPAHAYDLPGERFATAQVVDDAGEWSAPARVRVLVRDRAPLLAALPARIVADRAHDVALDPTATDPDGDAVEVAWRTGDERGTGPLRVRYHDLGEHAVDVEARDPFGANATARVIVDVQDLAPDLAGLMLPPDARADVPFRLVVDARDEDGPEPAVAWRIAGRVLDGGNVSVTLPAGTYALVVQATDADGAMAKLEANVTVLSPEAPTPASVAPAPPPAPARIPEAVEPLEEPTFDGGPGTPLVGREARFVLVPIADATAYRLDFGDGNATAWSPDTTGTHAWARPGAYEVRASARAADGRTSASSIVVSVTSPPVAKVPAVVQPLERNSVGPEASAAVSLTEPRVPAASVKETPGGAPVVGLLLATLGRRRARG